MRRFQEANATPSVGGCRDGFVERSVHRVFDASCGCFRSGNGEAIQCEHGSGRRVGQAGGHGDPYGSPRRYRACHYVKTSGESATHIPSLDSRRPYLHRDGDQQHARMVDTSDRPTPRRCRIHYFTRAWTSENRDRARARQVEGDEIPCGGRASSHDALARENEAAQPRLP